MRSIYSSIIKFESTNVDKVSSLSLFGMSIYEAHIFKGLA